MKTKSLLNVIAMGFVGLMMASCSIVRGYRTDGKYGPGIYSFEHHEHDTIAHGDETFQFPVAMNQASWIDTLHFFTQGSKYKNITFAEAMDGKSKTQGVMIIQNDSILRIQIDHLTGVWHRHRRRIYQERRRSCN